MKHGLAFLILTLVPGFLKAQSDLAAEIRALSPDVFSEEDREKARAALRSDLRARLQEANRRSSEAWSKIDSRESWEAFAKPRIAKLRESLGSFPEKTPLNSRVTGTVDGDGFRIENIVFESRPGLWVTANLYLPENPGDSMPGIILCHSHHRPKEHGELQDMGMTWARAGCAVLVPDHLGHGERRQHPFASESDYEREFRVSRQDYYFRYDTAVQLHLAGESLIGWMVWDLMRGVDLLLERGDIDPEKIILLGAVAGGGDPAAVAAAIDDRIAAAVPFNFGGPQPETRFPLPEDVETSFNYAGSGGWESTRNLRGSAADGFLPWVIVGSIAPRRLVFAHEFNWDRPRDPVWKRLQAIYGFYEMPEHLAFTHGKGELKGRPPESSHCTHIGRYHRRLIHPAFEKWFGISVREEAEYSQRRKEAELRCLTPDVRDELNPKQIVDLLPQLADERRLAAPRRPALLRTQIAEFLGPVQPGSRPKINRRDPVRHQFPDYTGGERVQLEVEPGIVVPVVLLFRLPLGIRVGPREPQPVVVAIAQGGRTEFFSQRSDEIAGLLSRGVAVCFPDLRGTGESREGGSRERQSADTGLSSTELMLDGSMVGARLRDLRAVIRYLESRKELDSSRLAIWGDSFAEPNDAEREIAMPRGISGRPSQSEPLGGMLALLAGLFEPNVKAIYINRGLGDFRSALTNQFVLIPHDVVVPGLLKAGDLPEIAAELAPGILRIDSLVDEANRQLSTDKIRRVYPNAIVGGDEPFAEWMAAKLAK